MICSLGSYLILFQDTDNPVTDQNAGGFESVVEYIPIGTPHAGTLATLDELKPSSTVGDGESVTIVAGLAPIV